MRACSLVSLLFVAACASGPENGYAVDLTITATATIDAASIASFTVDVSGDEISSRTYTLDHSFNEERLIYTPRLDSDNLTIAVTARDQAGTPIGYGETAVQLEHAGTVTAHVFLDADIPSPDMNLGDMGAPDLAGGDHPAIDLAADLSQPTDGSPSNADLTPPPPPLLNVVKNGAAMATGTIKSTAAGINCGSTCSASFTKGTLVTLMASVTPKTGTWFAGWGGDCASNNQPYCTVTMTAARNVTATFVNVNYVFVTSTATSLPLGATGAATLTQADMICNQLASGHLPGTYKAWLSVLGTTGTTGADPHVDARDRFSTARGWVRPDDLPFTDSVAALTSHSQSYGTVFYPPELDETGANVGASTSIHTGTRVDGTIQTGDTNCTDWTAAGGTAPIPAIPSLGSGQWTAGVGSTPSCGTARFYCFGVSFNSVITPPKYPGRNAFLSKGAFTPSGGIGAADSICQSEAMMAGLPGGGTPGSYLAMLAGSSPPFSAMSRFDASAGSPTWVRPDGIPLVPNAAALFAASPQLTVPFEVAADGVSYGQGGCGIWTGAANGSASGADGTTCTNWSSAAHTPNAYQGISVQRGLGFFGLIITNCDQCTGTMHVYCLQK